MPSSKHWSESNENEYTDDDGNVLYVDKRGKWRKYSTSDREFQQMYHYHEEDN